jgi:hypothetical protein
LVIHLLIAADVLEVKHLAISATSLQSKEMHLVHFLLQIPNLWLYLNDPDLANLRFA